MADPEYTYPGPRFFRAMLGVPILFEQDLIGVGVVVRREPEPFTHGHIALAQTFADQAAIALTNARLLEAVERQRTELSRFVPPQVAGLVERRRRAPAAASVASSWHLESASRLGYATLGRIGFEGRFDYGALGRRPTSPRDSARMRPPARR